MPATRKPGRPPRKASEKQNTIFSVRVTAAERKDLERRHRAERPDLTFAGFARFVLTGNDGKNNSENL